MFFSYSTHFIILKPSDWVPFSPLIHLRSTQRSRFYSLWIVLKSKFSNFWVCYSKHQCKYLVNLKLSDRNPSLPFNPHLNLLVKSIFLTLWIILTTEFCNFLIWCSPHQSTHFIISKLSNWVPISPEIYL